MVVRFNEVEKIILQDGWKLTAQSGSHCQYVHPSKSGKVTIPKHRGDLNPYTIKSKWKQAGIDERRIK